MFVELRKLEQEKQQRSAYAANNLGHGHRVEHAAPSAGLDFARYLPASHGGVQGVVAPTIARKGVIFSE